MKITDALKAIFGRREEGAVGPVEAWEEAMKSADSLYESFLETGHGPGHPVEVLRVRPNTSEHGYILIRSEHLDRLYEEG